jgi:hypothetical protein
VNHHYRDITDKLGSPLWWDENAVPRYCEFHPDHTANIYAREAVLLHIQCQSCGASFKVCMSQGASRVNWVRTNTDGPVVLYPTLAESVKDLHYGDPPNYGCCPAGPTMNSVPREVLKFWRREHADWERVPELEVAIEAEWFV